MLKRFLLFAIISFCVTGVYAQQKPQYTQYIFNNFLLNPAVAGIENYTDIKLGQRTQWTGLDGAPVTAFFSINAPLGSEFTQGDATTFPQSGGDSPYSRMYTRDYQAAEPHHGIGFMLIGDKAGPFEQTNMAVSYAYHLGLAPRLNLAVGVSAGANNMHINTALLTTEQYDPTVVNLENDQWKPDAAVGVWLYSSNYFVGLSAQQIIPQTQFVLTKNELNLNKAVPHYFFTAGYKLYLSDDVSLLPSALIKFIQPQQTSFDINAKLSFRDRFWFGGSYRKDDSFSVLAGFNLSSFINVSYSYDATTSALRNVSNGTHEIVLGIMLNNRYKLVSPQHGW